MQNILLKNSDIINIIKEKRCWLLPPSFESIGDGLSMSMQIDNIIQKNLEKEKIDVIVDGMPVKILINKLTESQYPDCLDPLYNFVSSQDGAIIYSVSYCDEYLFRRMYGGCHCEIYRINEGIKIDNPYVNETNELLIELCKRDKYGFVHMMQNTVLSSKLTEILRNTTDPILQDNILSIITNTIIRGYNSTVFLGRTTGLTFEQVLYCLYETEICYL